MAWIPFFAAGVVNGIGHTGATETFAANDTSRNIVPWGILVGGEELHNNHHAYVVGQVQLALVGVRPRLGLRAHARGLEARDDPQGRAEAQVRGYQVGTGPGDAAGGDHASLRGRDPLCAHAQATFAAELVHLRERAKRGELKRADVPSLARLKRWMSTEPSALPPSERARLAVALAASRTLQSIYAMREELSALWSRSTESSEQLLARLQDWCRRAEMSGIESLARFSYRLKGFA